MATVNELIRKTPLDVLGAAHIVESQIQDTSQIAGQIRQIAETNKQVSQLLNTLSNVPINRLLTTIGTQGNASNILALSSLRQLGSLDNVTDILDVLSIVDDDNNKLIPYGRKTFKGIKALGSVLDSIVDLVPLSAGVKLALKGSTGFLVSALVEFAPEIGDLIFEGFRAIEYELIELIIDKLFRDNNVLTVDSGKQCEDILLTLKTALLDTDNKPLINRVTQALRAGLLDYSRQVSSYDETDNALDVVGGVPVTQDNRPLIDKLIKSISTAYKIQDTSYGVDDNPIMPGVPVRRQTAESLELVEVWKILEKALLRYKRDAEGNAMEDFFTGGLIRESIFPERLDDLLVKALLKQDVDADGQPITDSNGQPVYISRFDFGSSDVASVLRECFKRPKVDDNGQPITDTDGLPLYADAFLSDIVDQLNQTTEVWTLDGVRLFIRDRLIEYT